MPSAENHLSASSGASNETVSFSEAQARGLVRYFTGQPCPHGHVAERYVRDGFCCECKRLKRAAYTAERGAEENAKRAAYYLEHRAAELARKERYNVERREIRGMTRAKRRASKLQAIPHWRTELDDLVELEANDLAKRREKATGFRWHVDHMIPLRAKLACGLHVGANLQVIPAWVNLAKKNRLVLTVPGDWITLT